MKCAGCQTWHMHARCRAICLKGRERATERWGAGRLQPHSRARSGLAQPACLTVGSTDPGQEAPYTPCWPDLGSESSHLLCPIFLTFWGPQSVPRSLLLTEALARKVCLPAAALLTEGA